MPRNNIRLQSPARFAPRVRPLAIRRPLGYRAPMRGKLLLIWFGVVFLPCISPSLQADQVEMQNGDRYFGKVKSVSSDIVVLDSEILGTIKVPRRKVVTLTFGANSAPASKTTNSLAAVPAAPRVPNPGSSTSLAITNMDLVRQIRDQMLAGSPAASAKYDELVNGLLNGKLNLDDIRRQAASTLTQTRALQRELGPEAGESLDFYLDVLDQFLKETAGESTAPLPGPSSAGKQK